MGTCFDKFADCNMTHLTTIANAIVAWSDCCDFDGDCDDLKKLECCLSLFSEEECQDRRCLPCRVLRLIVFLSMCRYVHLRFLSLTLR